MGALRCRKKTPCEICSWREARFTKSPMSRDLLGSKSIFPLMLSARPKRSCRNFSLSRQVAHECIDTRGNRRRNKCQEQLTNAQRQIAADAAKRGAGISHGGA